VATASSYASKAGNVFLDRRLYLPQEERCWDRTRGAKATVLKEICAGTGNWHITLSMMAHAWLARLRMTDEGNKVTLPTSWPN
jgi:hypothetical protein